MDTFKLLLFATAAMAATLPIAPIEHGPFIPVEPAPGPEPPKRPGEPSGPGVSPRTNSESYPTV